MLFALSTFVLFILCRMHKMAMFSVTIVHPRGEFGDIIFPLNNTTTTTNNTTKTTTTTTHHHSKQRLTNMPRILALYFPQYHADPMNDKHWGTNFTDWDSLRASPQFNREGFAIPRPTSELGYYDLSNVKPRELQGQLAKQYGVDGFIYHHYWFYDNTTTNNNPGGLPTLAKPLLEMLHDKQPDIPFFLNWCTVNWVNVWMGNAINQTDNKNCFSHSHNRRHGKQQRRRVKCPPIILQEQYFTPSLDEITLHYQWLSQFFHHTNYIHIDNQPIMLLYYYDERAISIIQQLRILAIQDGYDGIYWIVGRSAAPNDIFTLQDTNLTTMMTRKTQTIEMIISAINDGIFNQSMTYPYPLKWLVGSGTYTIPQWCLRQQGQNEEENNVTTNTTTSAIPEKYTPLLLQRQEIIGILTSFDNTPRRQFTDATIFQPDIPTNVLNRFRANLHTALYYTACCYPQHHPYQPHLANTKKKNDDDKFVVINAWNEWGEGMALEPSDIYGHGFLDIIKEVKAELVNGGCIL